MIRDIDDGRLRVFLFLAMLMGINGGFSLSAPASHLASKRNVVLDVVEEHDQDQLTDEDEHEYRRDQRREHHHHPCRSLSGPRRRGGRRANCLMIIDALCFPSWPSPLPLWGVVVARPGRLRHAADGPAAGRTGPGRGVLVAQRRRRPPLQGHRFRATVFEQPFPEYPSGWRLRFNGMGGVTALDHSAALRVMDGQGQTWELPNRSEELVPKDGSPVPAGSAQFDLDALSPRPSEAIPLEVELVTTGGPVRFDLTPEQTLQLNELAAG